MKKIALITTLVAGCLFAQQPFNGGISKIGSSANSVNVDSGSNNISQVSGANETNNISQVPGLESNPVVVIETEGVGVTPPNAISVAQSTVMARRSAIIDGYKALTEKLYGIKVNGRETVKDMVLQNSKLRSKIAGVIRGATIEEEDYRHGIYKVIMSLKFNVKQWNRYLKVIRPYNGTYYDSYN